MKIVEGIMQSVGETLPVGQLYQITQAQINAFGDTTEDRQYIHVDEARAKDSWLEGNPMTRLNDH